MAISTPPGRGGIGVVRLSGPEARLTAMQLVKLGGTLEVRRPQLVKVLHPDDPEGLPIDDALFTFFAAPHSYTGEDLVEIAAHGSPVVLDALLRGAVKHGARLARPGEFTERAFLSGRLGLTEAEAVHDLIAAQTLEQARSAASQLGGAISRRVTPAKEGLLHLIALLEAGMDFASGELDDVEVVPPKAIEAGLAGVRVPLESLAASFQGGQLLRTGASLALVGRPNVGKSSLFNRLLRRERAIVTPLPGTTRDTVEESFSLSGVPARLVDTAGLRLGRDAPADAAEAQGIARSREALADADLVIMVFDGSVLPTEEELSLAQTLAHRPHVIVSNKSDLAAPPTVTRPGTLNRPEFVATIRTSTITGAGVQELEQTILQHLSAGSAIAQSGALNNLRQHEAVLHAIRALHAAQEANTNGLPHEIILLELHSGLRALDELTGATTTDDILGRIFSTFCIGK